MPDAEGRWCRMFKKATVKETAKQSKKEIGRSQRDLQRQRVQLENDERRLVMEIKKAAKRGSDAETRILAKQLVQVRKSKEKLLAMNAQLGAVKTKTTMMAATETQATAIKNTTKAMKSANTAMNATKMQKNMMEFQRNLEKMDLNEEMMDDALAALDDEDVEEEADGITRQVLDEIGVSLDGELASAPTSAIGAKHSEAATNARKAVAE